MKRFTLLFDPGRIKRGLKPREEVGRVLEEGKNYTLVVDRNWPDAQGAPLATEVRKAFHVVAPDDNRIDTARWKIEPPRAGTTDPLVVHFGEPLDHSLLERLLSVVDASGSKIAGGTETADDEATWRFQPERAWQAGSYQLVVNTELEDLAGNSLGRAFDVDVFAPVGKTIKTETVSLPFEITAAP